MGAMLTADDIIDKIGGTRKVAGLRGYTDARVSNWRVNGIPKGEALPLANLAKALNLAGLSVEAILASKAAKRAPKALRVHEKRPEHSSELNSTAD